MKIDDRTEQEKVETIGFWIATDSFMSGWGGAPSRSIVACPVRDDQEDMKKVERRFELRKEMKRLRFVYGKEYNPRLQDGDHLHIYDMTSFRYAL